jgi:hypothetical protein
MMQIKGTASAGSVRQHGRRWEDQDDDFDDYFHGYEPVLVTKAGGGRRD